MILGFRTKVDSALPQEKKLGDLTNATLGRLALHCIKLCSICHWSRSFGACSNLFLLGKNLDDGVCRSDLGIELLMDIDIRGGADGTVTKPHLDILNVHTVRQ